MAEGLARARFGDVVRVQSAGSRPSRVNPWASAVMEEIGISLSAQVSKSVGTIDPDTVDVVVTLCAEEVCPAFLGEALRLDWPLPDPATEDPSVDEEALRRRFRAARDAIAQRLEDPTLRSALGLG
jgi:arsenate reductase